MKEFSIKSLYCTVTCIIVGKNPLTAPGKEKYKTDINAIASTLKAYFRELQTPLFPMDKYTEFIACAREQCVLYVFLFY